MHATTLNFPYGWPKFSFYFKSFSMEGVNLLYLDMPSVERVVSKAVRRVLARQRGRVYCVTLRKLRREFAAMGVLVTSTLVAGSTVADFLRRGCRRVGEWRLALIERGRHGSWRFYYVRDGGVPFAEVGE